MNIGALTGLVAVIMGTLTILIPIAGLTLRFAINPAVETIVRAMGDARDRASFGTGSEHRLVRIEERMDEIQSSVERLTEAFEFHNALEATSTEARAALADTSVDHGGR